MSYEITGTFTLPLPDDYQEMGRQLEAVTAAWRQFVAAASGPECELRLVQKRGPYGRNGAHEAVEQPGAAA